MRTSYSALETFKQCPQKYKFQEIDKIRVLKSKEAVFGTLIHSSLKYMFSRDPLFPTLDEVVSHFRVGWLSEKKLELSDEERKRYLEQGEALLKRFYAKNSPWNFNVVDLESRFEIPIEDPKTKEVHTLAGIMDRIDKPDEHTYEIIDYKTTRRMTSQESLDQNLQLSLYHLGLARRWPHIQPENITLSLYYLKHGEKLTTKRTETSLENTKKEVVAAIHAIQERTRTQDFPPQPSALCDWCGYKPMCPAWRHLYQNQNAKISAGGGSASGGKNQNEIKEIIKEYFALKQASKEHAQRLAELQRHIKAYMEQANITRVFGEEGVVAKTMQERFSYDFEKVHATLAAANRLDVWEALHSPDEKKLKKMLSELPNEIRAELEQARTSKTFEVLTASPKR